MVMLMMGYRDPWTDLKALQTLPGVDARLATHLLRLDVLTVDDLRQADPAALHATLSALDGVDHDAGLRDRFAEAVAAARSLAYHGKPGLAMA